MLLCLQIHMHSLATPRPSFMRMTNLIIYNGVSLTKLINKNHQSIIMPVSLALFIVMACRTCPCVSSVLWHTIPVLQSTSRHQNPSAHFVDFHPRPENSESVEWKTGTMSSEFRVQPSDIELASPLSAPQTVLLSNKQCQQGDT